ncbi:MAG: nitrate/sulfonate/bicarbonate ABC transporter ATP-binding protein, partial [Candidatus Micrarchaeia archaeon]
REDVVYMLKSSDISVNSVIMVTHNVEEAVEMSDNILVLSNKPTRIKQEIPIKLGYPRNRHSKAFMAAVDRIYELLTK